MSWEERQMQYIPELRCTYGQAWGSHKKTWKAFYIARDQGNGDVCMKLLERRDEKFEKQWDLRISGAESLV